LTSFEAFRSNVKLLKHYVRCGFVSFLFVLNVGLKSVLGGLLKFSNSINSLSDELIFSHITRINSNHLGLGFFLNLNFLDRSFFNSDSFTELNFVNSDTFVRSEEVERNLFFSVFFNTHVERVKNLEFVLEHLA